MDDVSSRMVMISRMAHMVTKKAQDSGYGKSVPRRSPPPLNKEDQIMLSSFPFLPCFLFLQNFLFSLFPSFVERTYCLAAMSFVLAK